MKQNAPLAILGASSGFTEGVRRLGVAPAEFSDGEMAQ